MATSFYVKYPEHSLKISASQSTIAVAPGGLSTVNIFRNDNSSTPVTDAGNFIELVSSTSAQSEQIWIFYSAGTTLKLGVGAAGAESVVGYIPPGGFDGPFPVRIAAGSRVSVQSVSGAINTGEVTGTLLG